MAFPDPEVLAAFVGRVFHIEDVTLGDGRKEIAVRYRGSLFVESMQAFDLLSEWVKPHGLTPLFRVEEGRQVIYLVRGMPRAELGSMRGNVIMFLLTLVSVLFSGALYSYTGPETADYWTMMRSTEFWLSGIPFTVSLLSILLAHEFGHYFAGRLHKTVVTLPYFIPMPFNLLGTMGAFIQLKEVPRNRRVLLDIGIAGPLAGLAVAIPITLYGLTLSKLGTVHSGSLMEGNSLLYLALKYLAFGKLLPEPVSFDGLSPALFWLRYFFTGMPAPIGALDVMIHPIVWAGWAGLLVTSLNLLPAGQLDGGHLMYVLIGRRTRKLLPVLLAAVGLMGFFWNGWWLWVVVLFVFGRHYAEPLDQITELDPRRRALAILGLLIFLLVFSPVPLLIL